MRWVGGALSSSFVSKASRAPFKGERSLIEGLRRGDANASNFTRSTCLTLPRLLQMASQDDAEFIATTPQVIQAIFQSNALGTNPVVSNGGLQAMFMRLVYVTDFLNGFNGCAFILCA